MIVIVMLSNNNYNVQYERITEQTNKENNVTKQHEHWKQAMANTYCLRKLNKVFE